MQDEAKEPERTFTKEEVIETFRHWRDGCFKTIRKKNESFPADSIWAGILLSRFLAKDDNDNSLSEEWASPAINALALLGQTLRFLGAYKESKGNDEESIARCDSLINKLDWALARIGHEIDRIRLDRIFKTRCDDLMLDILHEKIGDGHSAAVLLRHIRKNFPHVDETPEGEPDSENTITSFAWDAYHRVALLDALAEEYPHYLRPVAKQMHAWPVLRHRHTTNSARFKVLAEKLELGLDYPLDTRANARFRPDSPMVQYLDSLIPRLCWARLYAKQHNIIDPHQMLYCWNMDLGLRERDIEVPLDLLKHLLILKELPSLNKLTATLWSTRVIVPIIMLSDALGEGPYSEPAIEQIRKQRDIKSRAMLESRLESKVAKTLRGIAKPA